MGRAAGGGMPHSKGKKAVKRKVAEPFKSIGPVNTNINEQKEVPEIVGNLSDKHKYFAKRWVLNGGNASKAARESGFNGWYAINVLVKNQKIIDVANEIRQERSKKFDVNSDRIISELAKVAFSNLSDFLTLHKDGTPVIDCEDVGREEMAALAEITQDTYTERTGSNIDGEPDFTPVKKTKIKLHSKIQALDQLGRIFKLFGDGGELDKKTPEQKASMLMEALKVMAQQDNA